MDIPFLTVICVSVFHWFQKELLSIPLGWQLKRLGTGVHRQQKPNPTRSQRSVGGLKMKSSEGRDALVIFRRGGPPRSGRRDKNVFDGSLILAIKKRGGYCLGGLSGTYENCCPWTLYHIKCRSSRGAWASRSRRRRLTLRDREAVSAKGAEGDRDVYTPRAQFPFRRRRPLFPRNFSWFLPLFPV